MIMRAYTLPRIVLVVMCLVLNLEGCISSRATTPDEVAKRERMNQYKAQEDAIYEHMKRYGINRDDIVALRRLFETSPPYSYGEIEDAPRLHA
jgi:hypothetical protein